MTMMDAKPDGPESVSAAAYQAAEKLLRHNRSALVRGGRIRPNWIDGGPRFWYSVDTAEGCRFFLVDPAAGVRQEMDPADLPGTAAGVAAAASPGFLEVPSPDGSQVVFRRAHDLWVRSLADGREWPLTQDGEPDLAYGAAPFAPSVLPNKLGLDSHLPPAVAWSPDSTRVLTHLTDQRRVRRTHLVETAPADGGVPGVITQRYAYPGDLAVPQGTYVILDAGTGQAVQARSGAELMPLQSPIAAGWAWWADDGSAVYYLSQPRDLRTLRLNRLDPATGEVQEILTESGPTRIEPHPAAQRPLVRVLLRSALVFPA